MKDNIIDMTEYVKKKDTKNGDSSKKEPIVEEEIDFSFLKKLAEQVPAVKLYLRNFIRHAEEKYPEEVQKIRNMNYPGAEELINMGSDPLIPRLLEFIAIFSNSSYVRRIIVNEFFFVLRPILAGSDLVDNKFLGKE